MTQIQYWFPRIDVKRPTPKKRRSGIGEYKGRRSSISGEEVCVMRIYYAFGLVSLRQIATTFGIKNTHHVWSICTGQLYAWVNDDQTALWERKR